MMPRLRQPLTGFAVLLLLATAVWIAFGRATGAPLIFDDYFSVIHNDSLRQLWPLAGPLQPPRDTPFAGRPLVNLSAAVNYHFGQLDPTGYRIFNLAIHVLSATLLFGIVRRTLKLDYFSWLGRIGKIDWLAKWLAFAVALWWAVHPLQTESICYITQRTELMMGLCYLATLYCSLRYWQAPAGGGQIAWLALAVAACFAGMASKEVMVSAPLVVLLYERTFLARTFRQALRGSWPLYAGLCLSWLLLAYLVADAPRAMSAGFHLSVSATTWWLTQVEVVVMYLRLACWPWPQSIHHEIPYLQSVSEAWPYLLIVAILGGGTLVALWRGWAVGFLGAWFFIILSPTALVPITTEVAAERRMYLPLAAIVALVVVGGCWLAAALVRRIGAGGQSRNSYWMPAALAFVAVLLPALGLGAASLQYATVLSDPVTLWSSTLAQYPASALAHVNLGCALMNSGNSDKAVRHFSQALAINPNSPDAHYNWAITLKNTDQPLAAVDHLALAVELDPDNLLYRKSYGDLLDTLGRHAAAAQQYEQALRVDPDAAVVHGDLGMALKALGRLSEAAKQLAEAVRLKPEVAEFRNNYGNALRLMGQNEAAVEQFQRALALEPDMREARYNLALMYGSLGQHDESIAAYRQLLEDYPNDAEAHAALGNELFGAGEFDEARLQYERAVELDPKQLDARNNLGAVLLELGQADAAIEQLQEAVRLAPDSAAAHFNLAEAYAAIGRRGEALNEARQALGLAQNSGATDVARQIEAWLTTFESEQPLNSAASP